MMKDFETLEISIPADSDGYVLLKCPSCGERFMLLVEDIEDDTNLDIWCPNCGLKHQDYLDDETINLAERMIENKVADILNEFSATMKKSFKNSEIRIKTEKIKKQPEIPIGRKTGDFEEKYYECCKKKAKISSIKNLEGGYCPFCGEIVDGD